MVNLHKLYLLSTFGHIFQSVSRRKSMDPYAIARMAAMELDKKCPQITLPNLYCFTADFGEKPPDPEEVMQQMACEQREKERLLFVKRLRRMYHLSQSNAASSQRILDHHEMLSSAGNDSPNLEHLVSWLYHRTVHNFFPLIKFSRDWYI